MAILYKAIHARVLAKTQTYQENNRGDQINKEKINPKCFPCLFDPTIVRTKPPGAH